MTRDRHEPGDDEIRIMRVIRIILAWAFIITIAGFVTIILLP